MLEQRLRAYNVDLESINSRLEDKTKKKMYVDVHPIIAQR